MNSGVAVRRCTYGASPRRRRQRQPQGARQLHAEGPCRVVQGARASAPRTSGCARYRASGNQDPLRDRRLGASGGGGMRLESLAGVAAFRGAFPLPRAGHSAPECAVAALPVPFGGEERGRHARSLAQSRQPRRAALLSNQVQPGIPVQKVGHLHPVPDGPEVIRDGPAEVVEPRIVVVLRHRLL